MSCGGCLGGGLRKGLPQRQRSLFSRIRAARELLLFCDRNMQSVSNDNFGLLIAYLIPGLVVVWGVSYFSATVAGWLGAVREGQPTVGGFLYVTIASIAAGMLVSAARWLILDTLHHHTGIQAPNWDFGLLRDQMSPFLTAVEHNYRYYQFYSGMLVSLVFVYGVRRATLPLNAATIVGDTAALIAVGSLCFVSSRNSLQRYYSRINQLHQVRPRTDAAT